MPTYDRLYADFDSDLMRGVRGEAYGRDIGQNSWATAEEVESAIEWLALAAGSRLLDIGCGPGGPLAFIAGRTGCSGVGIDSSSEAVESATRRAPAKVSILQHDANEPLPFGDGQFDAVMSIDSVLHMRDREALFREASRVLVAGGRFWFTDAAVISGQISNAEIAVRAPFGLTNFVPAGFNEARLAAAGFAGIAAVDRSANVVSNASGRIAARLTHRKELEAIEGVEEFQRQQEYLEIVVALARRRALSRVSYTAVAP